MFEKMLGRFRHLYTFVTHKLQKKPNEALSSSRVFIAERNEIAASRASRISKKKAKGLSAAAGAEGEGETTVPAAPAQQVMQAEAREREARAGAESNDLVGLCFSGGGIRSATFNLGVVSALAMQGYLTQIDYLSTVSGGGYIGSWLAAWIKREGCQRVQEALSDPPKDPSQPQRYLEPNPVRFLRKYSNYLAPRTGLVSTDLWALVAIYVRNVLLNLSLLIAAGCFALSLPLLVLSYGHVLTDQLKNFRNPIFEVTIALLVIAMGAVAYSFAAFSRDVPPKSLFVRRPGIYVTLPLFAASVCLTYVLTLGGSGGGPDWILSFAKQLLSWNPEREALRWSVEGAVWYALIWFAGNAIAAIIELFAQLKAGSSWKTLVGLIWKLLFGYGSGPEAVVKSPVQSIPVALMAALLSGAVGGLCLYTVRLILVNAAVTGWNGVPEALQVRAYFNHVALRIISGPPLLMLVVVIVSILHVGLLGRSFPDAKREWLARLSAMLSFTALGWFTFTALAIYGAMIFKFLFASSWATTGWGRLLKTAIAGGWVGTTLAGLIGANRAKSKPVNSGAPTGLLLKLAPPIFIGGLFLLLAWGVDAYLSGKSIPYSQVEATLTTKQYQQMIDRTAAAARPRDFAQQFTKLVHAIAPQSASVAWSRVAEDHWLHAANYLKCDPSKLLYLMLAMLAIGRLLSWRLDVNEFSIHLLYRNRLTRCYLGASRLHRHPQPFTGFDVDDDVPLASLLMKNELPTDNRNPDLPRRYDGPYPLLCTALNLVAGKDLAWQTRKARSFIYSPLYCGYDYYAGNDPVGQGLCEYAFRSTRSFSGEGGPYLGTAMAISGAAATPNMGYHSSPSLTFLMGVFNVRLGWWAGNPRHKKAWRLSGPRSALYLGLELIGRTNDENRFVYLSDGGHFENLGLYELVHRKCPYIIACDAGCDPNFSFSDLGNAIAKCRRDWGAEILIDVTNIRPENRERFSNTHYALGTIKYDQKGNYGKLLYVKSSLTRSNRQDVKSFAVEDPAFPHDSTADQFFNETRFESYRALGEDAFSSIVADVTRDGSAAPATVAELFSALENLQPAE